jgi:rhomboid family protein
MFPIGDDRRLLRSPIVTIGLLAVLGLVWIFIQLGGLDPDVLAATICNLGLVPGEITHRAPVGLAVPMGPNLACIVDRDPINLFTPLTSMFLHGGWGHLLGNALFLWAFGKSVEDGMGRFRFLVFYLACGLAAAATQTLVNPASAVPMVGASGAISGVLGAYLMLYPRARVRVLFVIFIFIRIIVLPAWLVLLSWIGYQILLGLPELTPVRPDVSSGVAVWAHIGGFFTGALLAWVFANRSRTTRGVRTSFA